MYCAKLKRRDKKASFSPEGYRYKEKEESGGSLDEQADEQLVDHFINAFRGKAMIKRTVSPFPKNT
jgi:hypothetical protein